MEERSVPSHLLTANLPTTSAARLLHATKGPRTHGVDLAAITGQINQAYSSFANDVDQDIAAAAAALAASPVPIPFSPNPAKGNLSAVILQRTGVLGQQIDAILAPIPGASGVLLPLVRSQILGVSSDSLSIQLVSDLGQSTFGPFLVQPYATHVGNAIAASRLATATDVADFISASNTRLPRQKGRAALADSIVLAQVPTLLQQAFSSFQFDFQSGFSGYGINQYDSNFFPGSPTPPPSSVLASFEVAVDQRAGLFATQLGSILAPVPGASALVLLVESQIVGQDPGTLVRTITATLNTIKTSATPSQTFPFTSTSTVAGNHVNSLISMTLNEVIHEFSLFNAAGLAGGSALRHGK